MTFLGADYASPVLHHTLLEGGCMVMMKQSEVVLFVAVTELHASVT